MDSRRRRYRPLLLVLCSVLVACGPSSASQYLARAEKSIANKNYAAAAIDLKNALQADPEYFEARVALGRVFLELGDLPAAAHELRNARRLHPDDETARLLLCRALLGLGEHAALLQEADPERVADGKVKFELFELRGKTFVALDQPADAEQAFRNALALEPRAVGPRVGLSQVLVASQGFEAAHRQLVEARDLEPSNPLVANSMGRLYARERRYADAQKSFAEAVVLAESVDDQLQLLTALVGLTDVQLSLNDVKSAQATIARLIELAPQAPATRYLQARAAFLNGDYEAARSELQQILAENAGNTAAQLLLGAVSYAQGNLGQADMYLSGVIAAEPENSFARRLLADIRLRQQNPTDALAAVEPAVQQGDKSALALAGWAALQTGDVAAGISYLERDVEANPDDPGSQLKLAAGYIAAGRPEQAAALLERIPVDGKSVYRRDLMLIAARMRGGDTSGALHVAKRLVESRPNDPAALAVLANVLATTGQLGQAREQLLRAAKLAPKSPGPPFSLGRLDFQQRDLVSAERHFREALALRPSDPSILIAIAEVELAGARVDAAIKTLETACRGNPTAVEPRIVLGQLFLAQGKLDRAEALAQEANNLVPGNAAALNLLGQTLGASGRTAESLSSIEEAAKRQPRSATYRFNLARAYAMAGRAEDALTAARECVRIDPNYIPALALVGSLVAASNPQEAQGIAKRIREISPDHPAAWVLDGDLQFAKKQYAQAARSYQLAARAMPTQTLALREYAARRLGGVSGQMDPLVTWLERNPQDARVRLTLAQAQQTQGLTVAAIESYEAVVRNDPRNAVALNNLAWLYHQRADARALATARQAYEARPDEAAIADTYGWLLVEKGELNNGIELLRKAVRLAPKGQEIKYHLAVGLARAGQGQEAQRHLQELLDSPGSFAQRDEAARLLRSIAAGS